MAKQSYIPLKTAEVILQCTRAELKALINAGRLTVRRSATGKRQLAYAEVLNVRLWLRNKKDMTK